MRLIVWNMQGGFAYDHDRHERAWQYLRKLDPDVALLQEAVAPEWASGYGGQRYADAWAART